MSSAGPRLAMAILAMAMFASLMLFSGISDAGAGTSPQECADAGFNIYRENPCGKQAACSSLYRSGSTIRGGSSGCYYVVMNSNWSKVCQGSGQIWCAPGRAGTYRIDVYDKDGWRKLRQDRMYVSSYSGW